MNDFETNFHGTHDEKALLMTTYWTPWSDNPKQTKKPLVHST